MKKLGVLVIIILTYFGVLADDGYKLWLKYEPLNDIKLVETYQKNITALYVYQKSETLSIATKEFTVAFKGLTGKSIHTTNTSIEKNTVLLLKAEDLQQLNIKHQVPENKEGYIIKSIQHQGKPVILISSKTDKGLLYGVFHLIKQLQLKQSISNLNIWEEPKIKHRILNHWDNLDRSVERGYAGFSIWDWHKLPHYIDQRYIDYARANASIAINGTVLNNVNANSLILTDAWLKKVKALADVFRPYGIRVYLTARFSAPIEIGKLPTADPLDEKVQLWWQQKAKEIYTSIPDFGGFLVKANSEGQPGPQNYGRTHADGANMLAKALEPYDGIVMWRAFVYDNEVPEDRAKQAFNEFKPLDGNFHKNVIIQVKNGAIDFQPREPFHPLFGALTKTPVMAEFQLTQEYLGFATHLAYLAPLFKECLDADTYAKGKNSPVAKVIDGSLYKNQLTAIAGVANIGNDINWCGHPFAQANWYAYGRLAWNHQLSSSAIANEWLNTTFTSLQATSGNLLNDMMLKSRETVVNYMTPLGLHHIMGWDHHYGPAPWIKDKPRADWTSIYYHQADKNGIGFNRTTSGSKATLQYFPPVTQQFDDVKSCPEEYLLWFHHLPWDYKLKSGDSLWDGIVKKYYKGADEVKEMQKIWDTVENDIDSQTYQQVKQLLAIQYQEAVWWRDACVLYFQSFSGKPIPIGLPKPKHNLKYYQDLEFKFVPGI
ncbi:alpha-glucuronidase family glycosyl hydrolase [Pedobacter glucosidilyticus]|uniref:alpha-glucuronidase family glycosyl hydrolase n=1 Tax=Pedobacter glucosidilyticus TaxID=1122941 RepID=UPI0026EACE0B|nr:alpha-glucuronidase family glycosyl hydrolase [Pedobacter glucosidilyticus]